MVVMEGVPDGDGAILEALLSEEEPMPLSILMQWIAPLPTPPEVPTQTRDCWSRKLQASTPQSFVVSFLNYVRAEFQSIELSCASLSTEAEHPKQEGRGIIEMALSYTSKNGDSTSVLSVNENRTVAKPKVYNESSHISSAVSEVNRHNSARLEQPYMTKHNVANGEYLTYDENFPILGAGRVQTSQKSGQGQPKAKRRVNPTRTTNPVVGSAFVLAEVEPGKSSESPIQTQSKARSRPLKVDLDVLMQKVEKNRIQKPKDCPEDPKTGHFSSATEPKPINSNRSLSTKSLEKSIIAESLKKEEFLPENLRAPSTEVELFSAIHSKLLTAKLVPSLLAELRFLFQILSTGLDMHLSQTPASQLSSAPFEQSHREGKTNTRLFKCNTDCSFYACGVLEKAGRIIDSVGEQVLSALVENPVVAHYAPALLFRLKGSLASHQAAGLHTYKAYEADVIQMPKESGLKASRRGNIVGLPVSLPFDAVRDSRNNFKTRESQKVYNNRELCRDQFYAIVRDAASLYSAFGFAATVQEDAYKRIQDQINAFMKLLLPENYPWFTELFLEQVMQVAAFGETDPVVADLARQDPSKLQKLHDRLISTPAVFATKQGSNNMVSNEKHLLSPGSPWSRVKNKGTIPAKEITDHCQQGGNAMFNIFPQPMRVYVWFLETADSYRLNTQMVWSLKSKISKLARVSSHSKDIADIGSALTSRVLRLKSLAALLGFLFFSPGTRALPPVPVLPSQSVEAEWDALRIDPPVDIIEELEKAKILGSLLLTLPWVLDFLRLIKMDPKALSLSYFEHAITTLRGVYEYPTLDPENEDFGVGSICILAELDSFFEYMGMVASESGDCPERKVTITIPKSSSSQPFVSEGQNNTHDGLDKMMGIVDARYIQHCCPTIVGLRLILSDSQKRKHNRDKIQSVASGKSLRKITPVQYSKQLDLPLMGRSFLTEDPAAEEDRMKVKLQQVFFEQRPELQRRVDFIVDTAAGNAAHAASMKCVPPVLNTALVKLESAILGRLRDSSRSPLDESAGDLRGAQVEATIEHVITSAIQQAILLAMDYAKKHAAGRSSEALSALSVPGEDPFVLGIAAGIAADAAGMAACNKTLANISSEIRKRVMQEVENWRRNILHESIKAKAESLLNEGKPYENGFRALGKDSDTSKPVSSLNDISHTEGTPMAKRQLRFHFDGTSSASCSMLNPVQNLLHEQLENRSIFVTSRILCSCSSVLEYCFEGVLVDKRRNRLRLCLASVCSSIEAMLLLLEKHLPSGGFDALVFQQHSGNYVEAGSDSCNLSNNSTRIERGLIRRSIALGLRLCLLFPFDTVDTSDKLFDSISNFNFEMVFVRKLNLLLHLKSRLEGVKLPDESSANDRESKEEFPCNILGEPFRGLMSMWSGLANSHICDVEFLATELLVPWRWLLALQNEPWKTSDSWFQAVKTVIANMLMHLLHTENLKHNTEETIAQLLKSLCNASLTENLKQPLIAADGWLKKLTVSIAMDVLYLHLVQTTVMRPNQQRKICSSSEVKTCPLLSLLPLLESYCRNSLSTESNEQLALLPVTNGDMASGCSPASKISD